MSHGVLCARGAGSLPFLTLPPPKTKTGIFCRYALFPNMLGGEEKSPSETGFDDPVVATTVKLVVLRPSGLATR